jgi:hypothetical protein
VRAQHEHPAEEPADTHMRLLAPRRGAVCRALCAGTLITRRHLSFLLKRVFDWSAGPPSQGPLTLVAPVDFLKVDRWGHDSF